MTALGLGVKVLYLYNIYRNLSICIALMNRARGTHTLWIPGNYFVLRPRLSRVHCPFTTPRKRWFPSWGRGARASTHTRMYTLQHTYTCTYFHTHRWTTYSSCNNQKYRGTISVNHLGPQYEGRWSISVCRTIWVNVFCKHWTTLHRPILLTADVPYMITRTPRKHHPHSKWDQVSL